MELDKLIKFAAIIITFLRDLDLKRMFESYGAVFEYDISSTHI